jgi:hypothetical protein
MPNVGRLAEGPASDRVTCHRPRSRSRRTGQQAVDVPRGCVEHGTGDVSGLLPVGRSARPVLPRRGQLDWVRIGLLSFGGGSVRAFAMGQPDWGVDEAARSFGSASSSWDPVYSDQPEDVPEVAAARAARFFPADEAPLWCFIPAIWPVSERAWVRDCRVRHLNRSYADGRSERLPWTAAEYAEIEVDTNRSLADLGLPPRPAGRIWLLRPPPRHRSAQAVLDDVWAGWVDGPDTTTPRFVAYIESRLRGIF